MLESLRPRAPTAADGKYAPPFLEPLAEATAMGRETIAVVEAITKSLGLDNFMYGMTAALKPSHEANAYVFTTMPATWIRRYDDQAYIEIDPRIERTWSSSVPLVWDRDTFRDTSERCREFLADARSHSIGSGHVFISLCNCLKDSA
ncbi:MAG TPA: autoinducer binding domain-containing protein [Casimicrobiaceae bacterium]|nr:autoinducer binding domain-containing protein [Casimicrobiaceae bacterium]